jgi:hypothetical protein
MRAGTLTQLTKQRTIIKVRLTQMNSSMTARVGPPTRAFLLCYRIRVMGTDGPDPRLVLSLDGEAESRDRAHGRPVG